MSQISGIAAKFAGVCPLCSRNYGEGELITKISNDPNEKKRGHVQCVAALQSQSAAMRQIAPPPPVAPTPQHHAPAGSSSPLSGSRGDTHRALLQIAQGFDMVRAGLDVLIALVADRAA